MQGDSHTKTGTLSGRVLLVKIMKNDRDRRLCQNGPPPRCRTGFLRISPQVASSGDSIYEKIHYNLLEVRHLKKSYSTVL